MVGFFLCQKIRNESTPTEIQVLERRETPYGSVFRCKIEFAPTGTRVLVGDKKTRIVASKWKSKLYQQELAFQIGDELYFVYHRRHQR